MEGAKTPVFRRHLQGTQSGESDSWVAEIDGGPESDNEQDGFKKRFSSFVLVSENLKTATLVCF